MLEGNANRVMTRVEKMPIPQDEGVSEKFDGFRRSETPSQYANSPSCPKLTLPPPVNPFEPPSATPQKSSINPFTKNPKSTDKFPDQICYIQPKPLFFGF